MKRFLFLLLIFGSFQMAWAQFGVNPAFTKPSSQFGYLFKPAPSFGVVLYNTTLDERFQVSYALSFANYKARRDTFFSYGTQSGSGPTKYLPAYEIWSRYYMLSLRGQGDFLLLEKDFTPTVGFGVFINSALYEHQSVLETVISATEVTGDTYLGYSLNVGALYRINDTYQFKLRAGRVRARSLETGAKTPYYLIDLEFVIDFDEL